MPELLTRPSRHLSIEADHFYAGDLDPNGNHSIDNLGGRLKIAHTLGAVALRPGDTSSTVLMIDTVNVETRHEKRPFRPVEALARVALAAREHNVPLDYIALEGGFVPLAQAVLDEQIRPKVSANILTDPKFDSSWLYSDATGGERMMPHRHDLPPEQSQADSSEEEEFYFGNGIQTWVKLFSYKTNRRGNVKLRDGVPILDKWACPYLAAMFLAARLGSIKHETLRPVPIDPDNLPDYDDWTQYPAILQINPEAKPFVADRAFSYLPSSFLGTEHGASIIADIIDETIADRHDLAFYGEVRSLR